MNVTEVERLDPSERTALAKRLALKGEEIGHQLAKKGHPIVLGLGTFRFTHAGKTYITGEYSHETIAAMDAAVRIQVAREITDEPPSSRMTAVYFVIGFLYVVGIILSQTVSGQSGALLGVGVIAAALALMAFAWRRRSAIVEEDRARKAKHAWLEDVIAEPIWAGARIALSDYEKERLASQRADEIRNARDEFLASQPYYPSPEEEHEPVSITRPIHQELWNPPQRTSTDSQKGPTSRFSRGRQAETFKQAEISCARWLQTHGEPSAHVTQDGADGGIDIVSKRFVCQVKNYNGKVGVPPVRALYGISIAEGKESLFFTTGNYTRSAIEFADKVEMPLFIFDARSSDVFGANASAKRWLSKRNL